MARQAKEGVGEGTTTERRYYINSLPGCNAKRMAECLRGHGGLKIGLHWILDVVFREDECRIRKGYGAEKFGRLRGFDLNQPNKESSTKAMSFHRKRKRSGRNMGYLL